MKCHLCYWTDPKVVCWVGILWNCENWTESCSSCLLLNRKRVLLPAAFLQSSSGFKHVSFTVKGRHGIQTKSTAYDEKGRQRSHTLTDDWLLCVNFHPDPFITQTVLWERIYNSIPIKPSELNWQNNNFPFKPNTSQSQFYCRLPALRGNVSVWLHMRVCLDRIVNSPSHLSPVEPNIA